MTLSNTTILQLRGADEAHEAQEWARIMSEQSGKSVTLANVWACVKTGELTIVP